MAGLRETLIVHRITIWRGNGWQGGLACGKQEFVGIKATTNETMAFIGGKEGIAEWTVAEVERL